jgi:ribosomal protein S18 acetylase RimI-like enzyme
MDNLDSHIEIELGIPEELHHQAAIICCEGFFSQIEWLFGSKQKAITVLEHSFDSELGVAAQMQGQLVGFVGLKYENRPFLQFERSHCIRELGLLRGLLAWVLLNNISPAKPLSDEMYIAVLVVDASMRGKGIGSLLMQAAFEIAQQNQCTAVVLDVANTNPDARRLYERLGFKLVRTIEFRYLPKWISSGATIMRKELISSLNKNVEM